ncbi:MAG: cell division protein ZipA [SAR86 cluster bacterium]|uniref:Cell division protein ZipA n=1 Tax=SAR86 cluster bacterium TaxID=2030880 RepID=A0A2A5C860_9GAMM|nr:cell division protein ZipA [bacterium AH-315-I11]PCJ39671.1 MAG: cell division protein ZipA [SAR86 cluster bacterium]
MGDGGLGAVAELPNGGARISSRHDGFNNEDESGDEDEYQEYDEDADNYENSQEGDQVVPVLMDTVDIDNDVGTDLAIDDEENSFDEEDYDDDTIEEYEDAEDDELQEISSDGLNADTTSSEDQGYDEQTEDELNDDEEISSVRTSSREDKQGLAKSNIHPPRRGRIEPTLGEMDSFSADELEDKPAHVAQAENQAQAKGWEKEQERVQVDEPTVGQAELFSESPADFIQADDDYDEGEEDYLEPEEVIVINVMAKQGELFAGSDLLPILLQQGMQLGRMSIFHKHADSSGNGPTMFSMANMVKPGTFDVTQMEEFSTPGVSFFLQLPNALGNMKSFEKMLNAANLIKEKLNGDLKDEQRSVITRQTIEHCRQRIQDFELAQLSKKKP